jgi:hypothetical protein
MGNVRRRRVAQLDTVLDASSPPVIILAIAVRVDGAIPIGVSSTSVLCAMAKSRWLVV